MNSPIRQPIPSARENLVDSLETQLKAMTAERDMYSAKIKKLESQLSDSVNVSALRDTFITSVLEVFAYFLRYLINHNFYSIKDETSAHALKEIL
jgi:hypothetical protein